MSNSLVFLIEAGPFKTNYLGTEEAITGEPGSQNDPTNGHVTRVIRIFIKLMDLFNPYPEVKLGEEDQIEVAVIGCKTATIKTFELKRKVGEDWKSVIKMTDAFTTQGNIRSKDPVFSVLNLQTGTNLTTSDEINYEGTFTCDKDWVGLGPTYLATSREYSFNTTTTLHAAKHESVYLPFVPTRFPTLAYFLEM